MLKRATYVLLHKWHYPLAARSAGELEETENSAITT